METTTDKGASAQKKRRYVTYDTDIEFVTMRVAGQLFGLPVASVQDVLRSQPVARVPLAPKVVAGLLNLRGRIVTVVDMRARLGLPAETTEKDATMKVVVEHHGDLYSLMVDTVGEVLRLPSSRFEPAPTNMSEQWKQLASGVCRLEEGLLVILEVPSLLTLEDASG